MSEDRIKQKAGDNVTQIGKVLGNLTVEHGIPLVLVVAVVVAATALIAIAIVMILSLRFAPADNVASTTNDSILVSSSPIPTPTFSSSPIEVIKIPSPTPFILTTPTPTFMPTTRPAQDEEVLIIIVPFDGEEDIRPEARIEASLLKELGTITDLDFVRVERYPQAIEEKTSNEQIESLQETYNPTIIIWGWYDKLGIIAKYNITDKGLYSDNYKPTFSEVLRLSSSPDEFVFYVARDLPQEVNHLTFFTIAQIYFTSRDYENAQIYLERAIAELPERQESGRDALLLNLAWTRLVGFDDFSYTIEITTNLIENNPSDMAAYMLRGKTYEHMTLYEYIRENNINVTNYIEKHGNEYVLVTSADNHIPLEALRSIDALSDYNYIAEHNPELPEIYYLRGQQNYAHGNIEAAINDMQRVVEEQKLPGFLISEAENYIKQWSKELSE